MAVLLIAVCFSGCTGPENKQMDYHVPLIIKNNGETSAGQFEVNLYLDEERSAALQIHELDGSSSVEDKLMVTIGEGEHILKAIADEKNYVIESDEENNVDEIVYNFT